MINSITIHVRLGRDPEVRAAGSKQVCSVSAAMSQGKDKPSLWLELTAWSDNRFAFGDLSALRKGQACVVQGRLTVREYEKDGVTVQRIGITIDRINASADRQQQSQPSGRSYSSDGGGNRSRGGYGHSGNTSAPQYADRGDEDDSSIPF
jgi:single-stranded DNA-binding protein